MSRTEPTVSVVIPTFNRTELVTRAVSSVLQQTKPPHELVIVDDGSTDGTVERLTSTFPDVRVIRQENRGVSAARNAGIRETSGELVAFLDSDDAWRPEKLERQLKTMPAHQLIGHTEEVWIRNGRRVNPMKKHKKRGGHIFEHCLPLCAISPSSVLVHRSVFERVGTFDEDLPACEDYDLWLRVTAVYPVHFLDEPLVVKYGGHPDQLSRRYWGMDRFRIRALEKILASDILGESERRAAEAMLAEKIAIYAAGAKKRGKLAEAADYERRALR